MIKYFVFCNLPYEGGFLNEFNTEAEAREDYLRLQKGYEFMGNQAKDYLELKLIRGEILEHEKV